MRHSWDSKSSPVGGEDFPVWTPPRRPEGHNFALRIEPGLDVFSTTQLTNGLFRPTNQANAWVADFQDRQPRLTLKWQRPQQLRRVELWFDVDYDHAMESVFYGHPESVMPFCVKAYRLRDAAGKVVAAVNDNHHAHNVHTFAAPVETDRLTIEVLAVHGETSPAAVFQVRCMG